ncbi:CrcB protein [Angulomicrobium amanitiforme]|uniref:Fluoride-specific ion channel FluC n=1 Tax=Ancylobacter amanitiformis TaxID=217069 RepID=A0ABU0LUV6_9HYPH|nr:CrcB protein [Ancylobacter amanitiformis]
MSGMIQATLCVAAGGAIGSVARFWIALLMAPYSRDLPWGTLLINIVGSFVISFFATLTIAHGRYPAPELWRIGVMVGICGGFTTFSSFSFQTLELIRAGAPGRAMLNIVLSVALCLIAVSLGYIAAERLNGGVAQLTETQVEEETA